MTSSVFVRVATSERRETTAAALALLALVIAAPRISATEPHFGLTAPVGPRGEVAADRRVKTLRIDRKAVYEDYLVDAQWAETDAVRITADGVVLRNCEIRNGLRDAIEVYAADVLIENCRIHHFLAGTFKDQKDAHGITGRPNRLTIRNCEISYCSGDGVQFDPGRGPWTDVTIENCHFFTANLPAGAAGFKAGQRPGENAVDTKQREKNPRSKMLIRNCVFNGFAAGGQIGNASALNLKNHVDVTVENCLLYDNEIAVRARGPGTDRQGFGGALITLNDCYFYTAQTAFRVEDAIERLKVTNPHFGAGVAKQVHIVGGQPKGLDVAPSLPAPPLESLLGKAR